MSHTARDAHARQAAQEVLSDLSSRSLTASAAGALIGGAVGLSGWAISPEIHGGGSQPRCC
jgi:hypothetical protein